MRFHHVTPNSHYRTLRLVSKSGRWELGFSPYHFGMRLRMGLAGRPPQVMDLCLGRDAAVFPKVLLAVLGRLEHVSELATPREVDAAFPWAGTRPNLAVHLPRLLDTRCGESAGRLTP